MARRHQDYLVTLGYRSRNVVKGGSEMSTFNLACRKVAFVACVFGLTYSLGSLAEDIVSFATGGYAHGLRSKEMMLKIDTDGDGMISKSEWVAFHEKVFSMLDKKKTGKVDAKAFISASADDISGFATGGYARGLRTAAMMHKIDSDGDGTVSHDEFIAYQNKIFDMMNTSTAHHGMVSKQEIMFATGGANKP
jgi:EF-hand domain pair